MTWEDMETNGYVIVKNGRLTDVTGNMQMGRLVIGEDVTFIDGSYCNGFDNDTLKEVWIPRSVNELGNFFLYQNESITDVRMFCQLTKLEGKEFIGAQALERVVLPDSLERIGVGCFKDTPSLREVVLPEGLKHIGTDAFGGSGIKTLTIPDTVEYIDLSAFSGSDLIEIKLPASVIELGGEIFSYCGKLERVDMQSCDKITCIGYQTFYSCGSLVSVLLPPNCNVFESQVFNKTTNLKHLEFPDGFATIDGYGDFRESGLESVVWPTSLIDGTALANCDLKTIYYRGNSTQWNMTTSSALFPNAEVIFNYEGGSIES